MTALSEGSGSYDLNIIFGGASLLFRFLFFVFSFSLVSLFGWSQIQRWTSFPVLYRSICTTTTTENSCCTYITSPSPRPGPSIVLEGVCPQVGYFVLVRCACMEKTKTFLLNAIREWEAPPPLTPRAAPHPLPILPAYLQSSLSARPGEAASHI